MVLNHLKLTHFKNYESLDVRFSGGINCLLGKNGMGKTNLLDALHYLSMTRSAFTTNDQQNIAHGQPFFAITSEFEHEGLLRVNCYFETGKKKVMKVDGKEAERLSDHIGLVPSVLISPDDTEIIREGSEIRRKLFDSVIAQHDREYLADLMAMQRELKQRNSLLKQHEGRRMNRQLLEVYDEKLLPLFERIAAKRAAFVADFAPYFADNYAQIVEGVEQPAIRYQSECRAHGFEATYRQAYEKDVVLQRTTCGAHRDDYTFVLNDRPIKKFGSQGQQKSFLIALKLAEYDYLKTIKGFGPMLLLDDIFDKLDDERIGRLVTLLSDRNRFAQLFITDARAERSRQFFSATEEVRFFEIEDGKVR